MLRPRYSARDGGRTKHTLEIVHTQLEFVRRHAKNGAYTLRNVSVNCVHRQ